MSRPEDIPEDVWAVAMGLAAELRSAVVWHSNSANEVIATALARVRLAERERCANVATYEKDQLTDDDSAFGKAYERGYQHACNNVASAIRAGGQ